MIGTILSQLNDAKMSTQKALRRLYKNKPEPDPWDYPTVCITHLRFLPCRHGSHHWISQKPEVVKIVAEYQNRGRKI